MVLRPHLSVGLPFRAPPRYDRATRGGEDLSHAEQQRGKAYTRFGCALLFRRL